MNFQKRITDPPGFIVQMMDDKDKLVGQELTRMFSEFGDPFIFQDLFAERNNYLTVNRQVCQLI